MEIVGNVKTYDWGKLGSASEVTKLAALNSSDFTPNEDTPYSELWMGDHVSGPSLMKSTSKTLTEFITSKGKELIGDHPSLPFLFKVLSIRKALSIQVHPNKEEAEKLHAKFPDIYKDPNHKPELAIAITPFLALCGFREHDEIYKLCHILKPLADLIGSATIEKLKTHKAEGLKECYKILMTSTEDKINDCIKKISDDYQNALQEYHLKEIFQTINKDFPNDVGALSLFFLNVLHLKPGDAIFLPANELHAYLYGDCIECMACSDNVVRAGLTPKYKDIETLLRLINYEGELPDKKFFKPTRIDEHRELFSPPVKDFAVAKIAINKESKSYKMPNTKYGSILLVLQGSCLLKLEKSENLQLKRGSVIFIPGNCGDFIEFEIGGDASDNFTAYQAMYNDF